MAVEHALDDDHELRAKLLEGWVQVAARLVRAEQPPQLVFEAMVAVAVAGLLQTWEPHEAAGLLREIANNAEGRKDIHALMRDVDAFLRDRA